MFDRCVDGRLAVVEAEPPLDNLIVGVTWEWPKSAWYWAFRAAAGRFVRYISAGCSRFWS